MNLRKLNFLMSLYFFFFFLTTNGCQKEKMEVQPVILRPIELYFASSNCESVVYREDMCQTSDFNSRVTVFDWPTDSLLFRPFTVTSGIHIPYSTCFRGSGEVNLLFVGEIHPNVTESRMLDLVLQAIDENSPDMPTVKPQISIWVGNEEYLSQHVDREIGEFGYSDPNKNDDLNYDVIVLDDPKTCTGREILWFKYSFKGYIYNYELTDSIHIDTSFFEVNTLMW